MFGVRDDKDEPSAELVVVPTERHVERLAREGRRGETRASLRDRLTIALLPDVRFASTRETRLTLAAALEQARARAGQLELFGGEGEAAEPLLNALRGQGGASWVRVVSALDEALGTLRAHGVTAEQLDRVRVAGASAARARTLGSAMRALDEELARLGAVDPRLQCSVLTRAIRESSAEVLLSTLGTRRVRSRWIVAWDPTELAWWRALDETLSLSGGYARVVLPTFDKRLEGARERDPLEIVADVVARQLDAAPELEAITAVLGDLGPTEPRLEDVRGRVRLVRAPETRSEARVVAAFVKRALASGARVERVAIAYTMRDERTLMPLRRALADEGIVFYDAFGALPSEVPVVAAALRSLVAAESLDRIDVARVLRSGYVDSPRVLGDDEADSPLGLRDADRILARLARALETRATAIGADEAERLVRTASSGGGEDEAYARRVIAPFERARAAKTRGERVQAARVLFHSFGLASCAGRGGLASFARDGAPRGVERAERLAIARDVRAWELVEDALDLYETVAMRTGTFDRPLEAEIFRLELKELLDAPLPLPGAGRGGAVRMARLGDLAGEELDLLVVLDANDGVLPRDVRPVSLVSEALETAIARVARDSFTKTHASEISARDLAALATLAASSTSLVFVTTAEDGSGATTSPSRVVVALERAGLSIQDGARDVSTHESGTFSLSRGEGDTNVRGSIEDNGRGGDARDSTELSVLAARDVSVRSDVSPSDVLRAPEQIVRRAERERAREGFFLDPAREQSDLVGNLALSSRVDPERLRRWIGADTGAVAARALAVTSVERFAQCAFKGYAHVVLAAREGEEQHELPDAREEGNLGHTALAAAFAATREAWGARPRDAAAILERGLAAADAAFAESEVHAPLRAIVRLRVRESVRAVLLRAIADLDWDFAHAEQAFGNGKSWPAFRVRQSRDVSETRAYDDELWLRGSIDRVDRAHGRAAVRVVDYKRSKSTVRDAGTHLGQTALQVPLYAVIAGRQLGMPSTGAYMPIQPRDLATESKSNPRVEARLVELVRGDSPDEPTNIELRAFEVVRKVREGRLAPLPARESECLHCGVSGGCRKPRFAMAAESEAEDKESP